MVHRIKIEKTWIFGLEMRDKGQKKWYCKLNWNTITVEVLMMKLFKILLKWKLKIIKVHNVWMGCGLGYFNSE